MPGVVLSGQCVNQALQCLDSPGRGPDRDDVTMLHVVGPAV